MLRSCLRFLVLVFLLGLASCTEDEAATRVYYGGDILSMQEDFPRYVESIAVQEGKIVFVGSLDVAKKMYDSAEFVNLKQRALLPGFIDAHGHLYGVGLQAIVPNLLPPPDGGVSSVDELVDNLKSSLNDPKYQKFTEKTGWIVGFGYDDSQMDNYPTADDLDKVSKEIPIYIIHTSGHLGVANSKALELAGLNKNSKDPEGGVIRREEGGSEPNGILEEVAHFNVLGKVIADVDQELEELIIAEGQKLYASFGYTTAQEGRTTHTALKALERTAKKHKIMIDVVSYPDVTDGFDVMKSPFVSDRYQGQFRIGGVKINLDGSPQGKTAWLTKPYFKPPLGRDKNYRGYPTMKDEDVYALVNRAYENGWQILAHANGDAAIDQFISAITKANKKYGRKDRRPVLIHGQTLRRDQIPKLRDEGIFPSLFPMHTFYWGDFHYDSVLGPERAEFISPTKEVLKAGMMFTTHHDAPVALPDSTRVLDATVNRTTRTGKVLGKDQRVNAYTALRAMTVWASFQYFEEDKKGTIEVGKQADFVILDKNPLKVDPEKLDQLEVIETISRGNTVYWKKELLAE